MADLEADGRSLSGMSTSTQLGASHLSNVDLAGSYYYNGGVGGDVFVGRRWLLREMVQHLDSDLPTNGGFIVSGASGTGKTAFLKQLVKGGERKEERKEVLFYFWEREIIHGRPFFLFCRNRRHEKKKKNRDILLDKVLRKMVLQRLRFFFSVSPPLSLQGHHPLSSSGLGVVASHFCRADDEPTCLAANLVRSLASQLYSSPLLPAYREAVDSGGGARRRRLFEVDSANSYTSPGELLRQGIIQPLKDVKEAPNGCAFTLSFMDLLSDCDRKGH